jgi:hypothetical protein
VNPKQLIMPENQEVFLKVYKSTWIEVYQRDTGTNQKSFYCQRWSNFKIINTIMFNHNPKYKMNICKFLVIKRIE